MKSCLVKNKNRASYIVYVCVSGLSVAMMKHASLTGIQCEYANSVVWQSVTGYFKDFCWMIKLNKIFLLFCLRVCVVVLVFVLCVFVLPFLGADLRRPSGELRYVSAVAVPQSGLCPHALSLYHRPGGHVFPGHCPVFPG